MIQAMDAIPRYAVSQDWITVVFVLILLILALVKVNFPEKFYNFGRILISNKYFIESRKAFNLFGTFGYTLYIAQALTLSLGIYFLALNQGHAVQAPFIFFLQIFLLFNLFVLAKYLIEKMLGVLFSIEEFLDSYIFFKLTYKNFLAICLLPLLVLIGYIWTGNSIVFRILFWLFLLINLMALGFFYKKNQDRLIGNLFYFILYLCTFEIAPYFILYKLIT